MTPYDLDGGPPRPSAPGVPDHEHITVDEETYWGLYYVHDAVRRLIASGEIDSPSLRYLSDDAERRLELTREWNASEPNHAAVTEATP